MATFNLKYKRVLSACGVAMLLVGCLVWWRYDGGGSSPDLSRYAVRGIDVSAHNGKIDFVRVAADSISFAYIKATEGAGFSDSRFHDNYYAARDAGIKVGAYHFFRFDRPGDLQAVNLLQAIRGLEFDLPIAIDVEEWTNPDDVSAANVGNNLSAMIGYLESRGHNVIIYSNKKDYDSYLRTHFAGRALWLCSFVEPGPEFRWTFWQHTHRGRVDGIDGDVDLNVYKGTRQEWQRYLAAEKN